MWKLNDADERIAAERNSIRARYWLWLLLTLALVLAAKVVLISLTELPRQILLPEGVTLAAGLLVPLLICAACRLKLPPDEAQRGRMNAALAWVYCGMSAALLAMDFVVFPVVGSMGALILLLSAVVPGAIWDRCETELLRAGLILWGGNERRRRGKKRLTLLMLALGAALIIGYTAMRISQIESWEQYWKAGDYDVMLVPTWICVALTVCHGRIVSRRDQGDNIADKLEEKVRVEAACDEE